MEWILLLAREDVKYIGRDLTRYLVFDSNDYRKWIAIETEEVTYEQLINGRWVAVVMN